MTAEAGITPDVFFILGFPWEDPETIDETLELMKYLAPWVTAFHPAIASILIPFPGTEIYEKYKESCGLENWWLGNERNYDTPSWETHAYFETRFFPLGAVLDADFFHYSDAVKQKIIDVFQFMYLHNLQKSGFIPRLIKRTLLSLSLQLHAVSPRVERSVFRVLQSTGKRVGNGDV